MQLSKSALSKKEAVSRVLHRSGVLSAARRLSPNVLTVLNYHRIYDDSNKDFVAYKPNISASTGGFALQMDHLQKNYNVISSAQLAAWLRGESTLQPHSAIVTFDDGYYDNLSNASPILYERGLPATIFLTTDYIGSDAPFYWDYVAYCFFYTKKTVADLPFMGNATWIDEVSRDRVMDLWINNLKKLRDADKQSAISKLSEILDVFVPDDAFKQLYLTWDQVRELTAKGIEMGSHTVSHPILTRIPLSQALEELQTSKKSIEYQIGEPIIGFAYPNGQRTDFSPEVASKVKEAGFELAFTLLPGPTRYNTVKKYPFQIRRIFIGGSDTYSRFLTKLSGIGAIASLLR